MLTGAAVEVLAQGVATVVFAPATLDVQFMQVRWDQRLLRPGSNAPAALEHW
jgi:hypothetical protein